VYYFGAFGTNDDPSDPGGGDVVGNPAYAQMTRSHAHIAASMAAVGSLLNNTLSKAPNSAVGRAVIPFLDGTGGAYEELTGDTGTMADAETVVVGLSRSVAAALHACGPSSAVQYAPAQELAHDQMAGLLGGASNYNERSAYNYTSSDVAGDLKQMKELTGQEVNLQALGPRGNGGGCTVAEQMVNLLNEVDQSQGGFEQDVEILDYGSDRNETENLQATIDRIASQGLTPPPGAAVTVTRAQQAISAAIVTANNEIGTENTLTDKNYVITNAIAAIPAPDTGQNGSYSGSCKPGSWPLRPPSPIKHIRA
jgi:hypothetical protein